MKHLGLAIGGVFVAMLALAPITRAQPAIDPCGYAVMGEGRMKMDMYCFMRKDHERMQALRAAPAIEAIETSGRFGRTGSVKRGSRGSAPSRAR